MASPEPTVTVIARLDLHVGYFHPKLNLGDSGLEGSAQASANWAKGGFRGGPRRRRRRRSHLGTQGMPLMMVAQWRGAVLGLQA